MWYPSYLIHYNKNHSSKNGRFVSGDGDGDGIVNDHGNYARNKAAQNGGGATSLDQMIGNQIDEMVRKYNNPEKPVTHSPKKKDDKKKKKKTSRGSSRKSSKKKSSKFKHQSIANVMDAVKDLKADDALDQAQTSYMDVEQLLKEKAGLELAYLIKMLGK